MEKISFFTGDDARKALRYLLQEVRYYPDSNTYIDESGQSCIKDTAYFLEFGYPHKPRYLLGDGDHATNELGLCCGYYRQGDKWIAFDNSTGDCWVEEIDTESECKTYLAYVRSADKASRQLNVVSGRSLTPAEQWRIHAALDRPELLDECRQSRTLTIRPVNQADEVDYYRQNRTSHFLLCGRVEEYQVKGQLYHVRIMTIPDGRISDFTIDVVNPADTSSF